MVSGRPLWAGPLHHVVRRCVYYRIGCAHAPHHSKVTNDAPARRNTSRRIPCS